MNTTDLGFPSNRVCDIEHYAHTVLDPLYGANEVGAMMRLLFEALLGWDTVQLLSNRQSTINQSDLLRFHWAIHDLKHWRPIQQIIGYVDFCGCRIHVDEHTLIPRPETEEIVHWIIDNVQPKAADRQLLDLCTGSGCIAIALKKAFPEANVTAVDISSGALAMARRNALLNNTDIRFLQGDLLLPDSLDLSPADLIVSNPPYVTDSERTQMQPNVLNYEPALALFVPDDDPLRFYTAIALLAQRWLKPDGILVVEINEHYGKQTLQLLDIHGLRGTLLQDFRGKERAICATKKCPEASLVHSSEKKYCEKQRKVKKK